MVNKRGWIKIVEAITAILLISAVIFIVIDNTQRQADMTTTRVQNSELEILRNVETNSSLRAEIIGVQTVPSLWNNIDFPPNTKAEVMAKTPGYLACVAQICSTNDICTLASANETNIYAQSVIITATNSNYNPRQFKLFCWEK
jgi:hypothetical protein